MAQPGSAPGLGPGGRRFESCLPDLKGYKFYLKLIPFFYWCRFWAVFFVRIVFFFTEAQRHGKLTGLHPVLRYCALSELDEKCFKLCTQNYHTVSVDIVHRAKPCDNILHIFRAFHIPALKECNTIRMAPI